MGETKEVKSIYIVSRVVRSECVFIIAAVEDEGEANEICDMYGDPATVCKVYLDKGIENYYPSWEVTFSLTGEIIGIQGPSVYRIIFDEGVVKRVNSVFRVSVYAKDRNGARKEAKKRFAEQMRRIGEE